MAANYFRYWGKASQDKTAPSGDNVHLLPYHCLDVAACGYWLLKSDRFHAKTLFNRVGLHGEEAGLWFAFFLALHDLGKFARGFQQLAPAVAPWVHATPRKIYDTKHDTLGFWLWQKCIRDGWQPFPGYDLLTTEEYTLDCWLAIVTGHHGIPPTPLSSMGGEGDLYRHCHHDDVVAAQAWMDDWRTLLVEQGLPTQLPATFNDKKWRKNCLQPASWPLAGLAVLADWLGSNTLFFNYCGTPTWSLADYWQHALVLAEKAVATLAPTSPSSDFKGLTHLFPSIHQATPLQHWAESSALAKGPQLFILEDVTGAGKTEAALVLTHRLLANKQGHGCYIGLPTMATANAMFKRLQRAYRHLFSATSRPSLVLTHSARQLNTGFTDSLWCEGKDGVPDDYQQETSASSHCRHWFNDNRKKSLLAEVGIGTLDQALMAVLPFKHQSLRMLGLHGKVLLLDEVHAYDAYMGKLLGALLTYHASQGGSAIILTATLSQTQRKSLTAAFARGLSSEPPTLAAEAAYPLITHYAADGLKEIPVATRETVRRHVAIDWRHDEQACLECIHVAVTEGHCVAWIRNSVDDAIRSYTALAAMPWMKEDDLLLFHSRFAFVDRLRIEDKTQDWFDSQSTAELRRGKVIIATQVIEQSLDIDVDVMLSDLAPVDLLVQRAGRLQRHIRDAQGNRLQNAGKDQRPAPCLIVHAPPWSDEPDSQWLSSTLRNTGYVYPNHGLLWLSQRILRKEASIRMPDNARLLVESVYGDAAYNELPVSLQAYYDKEKGKQMSERAAALQLELNIAVGYSNDSSPRWGEEIELSTRLGEPSVILYLARRLNDSQVVPYAPGPFAWDMSRLQVRETLWNTLKKNIPHLTDDKRKDLLKANKLNWGEVLLLPESIAQCPFYSTQFGFHMDRSEHAVTD